MTPNELRALADALHDASASLNGTHFVAARKAAAYLRAQAEAQPVAIVGEQRSGAWAGADTPAGYVWSPPSDSSTKMIFPLADLPLDTKLYTHPAPAVPQAEPDDDDALVLGEPDILTPEDVRRLVPQTEPKREPWSGYDEGHRAGYALAQAERELSEKQIADACYRYRHDFGLLDKYERDCIVNEARRWAEAFGIGGSDERR